jgi:hypothetical protein
MSAALRPSAASALLSVLSCVCCATLPGAAEFKAVEVVGASCELDAVCALVLDALGPDLAEAACAEDEAFEEAAAVHHSNLQRS